MPVALVGFLPVESASALLLMVEAMVAPLTAFTVTLPVAVTTVSTIFAVAPEPTLAPKALLMAGSPMIVSMVLNRTFCPSQPMLLKASVTAAAVADGGLGFSGLTLLGVPLMATMTSAAFTTVAVTLPVLVAWTSTFPPAPWVVSTLGSTTASALLTTTFVPMMPPTPSDEPVGRLLASPNSRRRPLIVSDAWSWLVLFDVIAAVSSAFTSMGPVAVTSRASVTVAPAPPRTSLSDTAPATPMAL